MDWYKIYHGLPADPRLPVIARRTGLTRAETLALWITLHDYASRQKPRGSLYGFNAEEAALLLETDAAQTEAALDAFYEKGMIDIDNNIRDWARLQYKSTDRVRAHRARKREEAAAEKKPRTPETRASETRAPKTHDLPRPGPARAGTIGPDDENEAAARRARLQQQALRRKGARPKHDD